MTATENFRVAMHAAGLEHTGPIVADGKLHRFKTAGDHHRNSWFVLFPANTVIPAAGAFGCWKRSVKETWCAKRRENLTGAQWRAIRGAWQNAEAERERAEMERQAKARKIAAWILNHTKPLTAHSYLTAKGVKVFGDVREYRGALALPLRDVNGGLHSLQFIGADGEKRFLSGGRIAGCFFTLADKPDGALVICEGYATGASILEATGFATLCAMNCGNLLAVATSLREKFPQREIIVAGDNDQWTDGNPGFTKATEAAKATGARLAVPQFKDVATKPTDFNDLAALVELAEVKRQIESAAAPKETDEEILQRLAMLPPLEYERQRDNATKSLGCRAGILDKLVESKRPKQADSELQGRTVALADVEPWPDSVAGADVLSEVAEAFGRYAALPPGAANALALWVAHAHSFKSFLCSPRLNISSPEKGCGKTTLRDVVSIFTPRPLLTENLSVAVLFRVVEAQTPTVLADECDGWLKENEELLSLLNSGHRRGGQALRCEGESNEVRAFNVFSPAVICGIGALPGTLHDRSIVIQLQRAKPGELRERFDSRHVENENELCRKLARFVADNAARLETCDPQLPDGAYNRLADNWRPLFAIAEIAGGNWPQCAADAFAKLTSREDSDAQGIGTALLADIADIFNTAGAQKLPSAEIVDELAEIEGHEWAEWGRARKPISTNQLAKLLRRFNVSPRTIKLPDGSTAKGYHREMFTEAFARYLPCSPSPKCNPVTVPENIDDSAFSKTSPANGELRIHSDKIANKNTEGDGVTAQMAGKCESEALLL